MIEFGLRLVNRLKPCTFKFKAGKDNRIHIGFIAQDIEKLLPKEEYAIITETVKESDNKTYLTLDKSQLVAPLVLSIQELSKKIDELEKDIKAIKKN